MGIFKQTFAQLQALFDKHDKVLTKDDVINNLTSDTTDKPLSAAQGKALKESIPQAYTLPEAGTNALGGIKTGFTQTGKKYPVALEGGKAYVEVPWTDNNTTYQAANTSTLGLVKQSAAVTKPADSEAASLKTAIDAIIDAMKASGQMA